MNGDAGVVNVDEDDDSSRWPKLRVREGDAPSPKFQRPFIYPRPAGQETFDGETHLRYESMTGAGRDGV